MNKVEQATEYLDQIWRPEDGLPTSPSHLDNWGENLSLYVDAHIATGHLERALVEFELWRQSRFPETGFSPHYMLGERKIAGIDTKKLVDARVQKVITLRNGRKVTSSASPANWAIAAESIDAVMAPEQAKEWVDSVFDDLVQSSEALYIERDVTAIGGLIVSVCQDELTLRDGILNETAVSKAKRGEFSSDIAANLANAARNVQLDVSEESEQQRLQRHAPDNSFVPVVDVAINALMDANNDALVRLAEKYSKEIPFSLRRSMMMTKQSLPKLINQRTGLAESVANNISGNAEDFTSAFAEDTFCIEGLVAVARSPRTLAATLPRAGLIIDATHSNSSVRPVPTLFSTRSGKIKTTNKVDYGAVSPADNLEIASSLKDEYDPNADDFIFKRLGKLTMWDLSHVDGFPRSLNPFTGESNVGSNFLTRRINKSQKLWTPTAARIILAAEFASEQ